MIGLWIDSLTDEERDRIVEAQEWAFDDRQISFTEFLARGNCIVGHVCALTSRDDWDTRWKPSVLEESVPARFDHLCARFGLDRVVRACKIRAGADVAALQTSTPEMSR